MKLSIKKYFSLLVGVVLLTSCEKDQDAVLTQIKVINEQITPLSTSAIVQCNFETKATLCNVYVQYATTIDFSKYVELKMMQENGMYTAILEDLQLTTTYYVRYVISNHYSSARIVEIRSFQTLPQSNPTVTTYSVKNIGYTSATIGGYVIDDGGISVMERGVVYSENQNPTISDSRIVSGNGTGKFTCTLTNLQPNTTYFVRAYAVNGQGTAYGEQVAFITKEPENGHESVDLGLTVKWATMNVGAEIPEHAGAHSAWGEESNWGGSWRMPTDAEWTELCQKCTWTWTTRNGRDGYKVTGRNGNSIFLPVTGIFCDSVGSNGHIGYYWSSSFHSYNPPKAICLIFDSSDVGLGSYLTSGYRTWKLSTRLVCPFI